MAFASWCCPCSNEKSLHTLLRSAGSPWQVWEMLTLSSMLLLTPSSGLQSVFPDRCPAPPPPPTSCSPPHRTDHLQQTATPRPSFNGVALPGPKAILHAQRMQAPASGTGEPNESVHPGPRFSERALGARLGMICCSLAVALRPFLLLPLPCFHCLSSLGILARSIAYERHSIQMPLCSFRSLLALTPSHCCSPLLPTRFRSHLQMATSQSPGIRSDASLRPI